MTDFVENKHLPVHTVCHSGCLHVLCAHGYVYEQLCSVCPLLYYPAPLFSLMVVNAALPPTLCLTVVAELFPLLAHTMEDGYYDRQRLRDTSVSH